MTTIQASAQGYHLLLAKKSITIRDLTMIRIDQNTNTSWGAIRLDLSNSGPAPETRVICEQLLIDGFDISIYCDGYNGTGFGDLVTVSIRCVKCVMRSGGANAVKPTLCINNAEIVDIEDCCVEAFTDDNTNNIYLIGSRIVRIHGCYLKRGGRREDHLQRTLLGGPYGTHRGVRI